MPAQAQSNYNTVDLFPQARSTRFQLSHQVLPDHLSPEDLKDLLPERETWAAKVQETSIRVCLEEEHEAKIDLVLSENLLELDLIKKKAHERVWRKREWILKKAHADFTNGIDCIVEWD